MSLTIHSDPLAPASLIVRPWADPVVERVGFPPSGDYVELFWLGILGPTATWLLRRLAVGLESYPDGFELDLVETAAALGVTVSPGRPSTFQRAVDRCVLFGLAHRLDEDGLAGLAVRRSVPPLAGRQIERLPTHLRVAHRDWLAHGRMSTPPAPTTVSRIVETLHDGGEPEWRIGACLRALGVDPAGASHWLDHRRIGPGGPFDPTLSGSVDGSVTMRNDGLNASPLG